MADNSVPLGSLPDWLTQMQQAAGYVPLASAAQPEGPSPLASLMSPEMSLSRPPGPSRLEALKDFLTPEWSKPFAGMSPQQANQEAKTLANPDVNAPGKIGPGYLSDSSRLAGAATDAASWLAPELKGLAALKGMAGLVPKAAKVAGETAAEVAPSGIQAAISDFPALLKSHGPDFANASIIDHQGNILHNPIGRESVGGPMLRVNEDGSITRGILAYHGSPHDFDRFDLSRIGTGEGAQAYGHGLYFAENEGVARGYRDKLAGNPAMGRTEFRKGGVEGKPYDPNDPQHVAAFYAYQNGSPSNAAKALEQEASLGVPKDRQPIVSQAIDLLKSGKAQKFDPNFDPGKMYQVAIKADPEHFLDWDKPLSEQSEHVRDKLKSLGFTDEPSWRPTYGGGGQDLRTQGGVHLGHIYGVPGEGYYAKLGLGDTPTRFGSRDEAQKWVEQNAQSKGSVGADVHRVLSHSNEANDPVVAEKLREAGIPGIKYLDQGSRLQIDDDIDLVREHVQNAKNRLEMWGKDTPPDHPMRKDLAHWQEQLSLLEGQKPQTRNYAVFDDKLIDILKKYGLAGLAALPAIQAAQQRQAVPLSSLAQ